MGDAISFKSKSEIIYERLCSLILGGKIRPGERVNTDALSREFGVSKIPMREALRKLEFQGLVVQSPHSGARVAPLSFQEMRGIFLIRGSLEGLAARIAATTVSGEELGDLWRLHAEMETEYRNASLARMTVLNRRFHTAIAYATRFEVLAEMTESTLLRVMHYRVGIRRMVGDWGGVLDEHAAILSALRSRDSEAAERAAKEHVERQLEIELKAQIDTSLFVDDPIMGTA